MTNYVLNLLFILNLYGQKFSTLVRCLQIFYNKKSNHICQLICRSTKQISTSSCTKIFTSATKCLVKEILFGFLNGAIFGVQYILVLFQHVFCDLKAPSSIALVRYCHLFFKILENSIEEVIHLTNGVDRGQFYGFKFIKFIVKVIVELLDICRVTAN